MLSINGARALKFAAAVALAMGAAACAKNPGDEASIAGGVGAGGGYGRGAATPGSQQDFVVNVGDATAADKERAHGGLYGLSNASHPVRWERGCGGCHQTFRKKDS